MAEMANLSTPTAEVATTLGEDATFRLKQVIARAQRFMRHANRSKLTCADINEALKWSDSQPVFGHECNSNQALTYSYLPDAQVFFYNNETVDLQQRYKSISQPTEEQLIEAVPEITMSQCEKVQPILKLPSMNENKSE